jgi:hypothetical protein
MGQEERSCPGSRDMIQKGLTQRMEEGEKRIPQMGSSAAW